MWPGPRNYRAFAGEGQDREAVGRAVGKGVVDNEGRFGQRAAVDGDKVWDGPVRRRAEFNRGKVWLP